MEYEKAMTTENDKQIPGASGKDQRPHATLDLTATEIFPGGKPDAEAQDAKATPPGATASSNHAPRLDGGTTARAARSGFLTHMAAGLVGATLALLIAFYIFGGLRDRQSSQASRAAEGFRQELAAAERRIAALENAAQTAKSGAGDIEARLKAASDRAGALKQDIAALDSRVKSLESAPAPKAAASADLQPVNAKLADLNDRVAGLAKAQDALRSSTGTAAMAMAVQNLRRAIAEGKPFASELKTLTTLAGEPLDVAALEPRRESGLASLATLQREFDRSAMAAIEASRPPADGSFTGNLLAKARGLVRVRPTGDVPGSTPEAVLARAENRLDSGDLSAAIRETGELAGPAAAAMTPWLSEAKARAAADETLARIEAKLMTSSGTDEHDARRGG
jgi:hypothetical protein